MYKIFLGLIFCLFSMKLLAETRNVVCEDTDLEGNEYFVEVVFSAANQKVVNIYETTPNGAVGSDECRYIESYYTGDKPEVSKELLESVKGYDMIRCPLLGDFAFSAKEKSFVMVLNDQEVYSFESCKF